MTVFDANATYALPGSLHRTFDAGDSWDTLAVSTTSNYLGSGMHFLNQDIGWVAASIPSSLYLSEFLVLGTNDGGISWTQSEKIEDFQVETCYFVNSSVGWALGHLNIYKTYDGGESWTIDETFEDVHTESKRMIFVDETHGWLLTSRGEVFKYSEPA